MDCRVKPGNDEEGHLRESRGEIAGTVFAVRAV
jgi:hypothetical protein